MRDKFVHSVCSDEQWTKDILEANLTSPCFCDVLLIGLVHLAMIVILTSKLYITGRASGYDFYRLKVLRGMEWGGMEIGMGGSLVCYDRVHWHIVTTNCRVLCSYAFSVYLSLNATPLICHLHSPLYRSHRTDAGFSPRPPWHCTK